MRVELIAVWSIRVGGTYFWAPALEFSTLLEVTEAGTILVHASCTRPTRCTPVLLGFKGGKMGVKVRIISSLPVFATPTLGLPFWNFRRCWRYPRL